MTQKLTCKFEFLTTFKFCQKKKVHAATKQMGQRQQKTSFKLVVINKSNIIYLFILFFYSFIYLETESEEEDEEGA